MSIAGVGSHTDYYYGIGMQRQVTGKDENFGTCLQGEGAETVLGEQGSCSSIDRQELYEAMSNGFQFSELNAGQQVGLATGAVTIAECEEEGEFLGLTMIPEEGQSVTYGMRAMLPENSTPVNPIVQVVSNLGGEKKIYNVEINKVDPNNATQLEMFALLSYMDKKGITDGDSFGSFHQLKVYGSNASMKGYCEDLSGGTVFINEKFEWPVIIEKMMKDYFEAEIYKQSEDCQALLDFFTTYIPKEDGAEQHQKKSVTCTFDTENLADNDVRYTTTYTEEGMVCRREGQAEAVWTLKFENPEQYEKVAGFIEKFPEDWNLIFASREDFWKDFLDDKIDVSSYEEYIVGTSEHVPEGMVIERSIVSLSSGVSFYMSEDTGEVACIDDSNKLPGRQCLWSKFLSEEDFVRCKELFEREKGEATWEYKYGAYLSHKSFWDMYLSDEIDLSKLEDADKLFKDEELFDRLLEKCPDSVKNAWELALEDVGDLFSLNSIGNVNYYSELYNQVLFSMIKGNDFAVLGTTEEDAISFAQNAIDSLNNTTGYNNEALHMREREKRFYEGFISNLMK